MEDILLNNIKLNKRPLPKHIAIIMDGNGRWAQQKGLNRTFGHRNAVNAVRAAIEGCGDLEIPYLTLFAFSTENWNRPKEEINYLFRLLIETLKKESKKFNEEGVRLKTIGDLSKLPSDVRAEIKYVEDSTKNNSGKVLSLALNYGAQSEILQAVKNIAELVKDKKINVEDINEELFEQHLYTQGLPPVDLMIRTSGEYRISNFLLWQLAYSELYFCDVLWPDFKKEHFFVAINDYQKRERRFGKTSSQIIKA